MKPTTKKKTFGSNLNTLTKAPTPVSSTSRYGPGGRLLSLGKVGTAKTLGGPAAPIPLNTPSLRKESGGQDTKVQLVPTGPGWCTEPEVEPTESSGQSPAKMAPWARSQSTQGTAPKTGWAAGALSPSTSDPTPLGTSPVIGSSPSLGGTRNMKWGDLDDDDDEDDDVPLAPPMTQSGGFTNQTQYVEMNSQNFNYNSGYRPPPQNFNDSNDHGRYEQNDDTHGRRNDSRQNMRPPPAINQEPNSQVKSQVNSDASLPGESQTEYMMRTAKIRREKRLAEEEEAEKERLAKAFAKQREIEEKISKQQSQNQPAQPMHSQSHSMQNQPAHGNSMQGHNVQGQGLEQDDNRTMWRRTPLPPAPPSPQRQPSAAPQSQPSPTRIVLRPTRSPSSSPQVAPQAPPRVDFSKMDDIRPAGFFMGNMTPDHNTMMAPPQNTMPSSMHTMPNSMMANTMMMPSTMMAPHSMMANTMMMPMDSLVKLEDMAPRSAAAPRQLYDPKSDTFVEHDQRTSDNVDTSKAHSQANNRKVIKERSRGAPSESSSSWKKENIISIQPKDTRDDRKKDDKAEQRKKQKEEEEASLALDRKAARALERANRPPRTPGKLYLYNASGELVDADKPEDQARSERKKQRTMDDKARIESGKHLKHSKDKFDKSDRKDKKSKGKRGDSEEPEEGVTSAESKGKEKEPEVKRTAIPPPPAEAWGLGKNPLITVNPTQDEEVVPVKEDLSSKRSEFKEGTSKSGGKGSRAVGRKPNNNFAEDNDLPDIGFSSFNHFSGNDLWQGESPTGLAFQSQSPLVFGGGMPVSLAPGQVNASSATWGVGGLQQGAGAPVSKLSGLYGFGLEATGGQWSHEDQHWENEVLAGLGDFDMDNQQSTNITGSELNPSAPDFQVKTHTATSTPEPPVGKKNQRGADRKPQRSKHKGKGSSEVPTTIEGSAESQSKPNAKNRGKGKAKQPVEPKVSGEAAPSNPKKGRGKGKGKGKTEKVSQQESKKADGADANTAKETSSRRRGKGGKGKKDTPSKE